LQRCTGKLHAPRSQKPVVPPVPDKPPMPPVPAEPACGPAGSSSAAGAGSTSNPCHTGRPDCLRRLGPDAAPPERLHAASASAPIPIARPRATRLADKGRRFYCPYSRSRRSDPGRSSSLRQLGNRGSPPWRQRRLFDLGLSAPRASLCVRSSLLLNVPALEGDSACRLDGLRGDARAHRAARSRPC